MAVQMPGVQPPAGAGTSTTVLCSVPGARVSGLPSGFLIDHVSALAGSSCPATSPDPRSESVVSKPSVAPSAGLVMAAVGAFGCDGISVETMPVTRFQPSVTYGTSAPPPPPNFAQAFVVSAFAVNVASAPATLAGFSAIAATKLNVAHW